MADIKSLRKRQLYRSPIGLTKAIITQKKEESQEFLLKLIKIINYKINNTHKKDFNKKESNKNTNNTNKKGEGKEITINKNEISSKSRNTRKSQNITKKRKGRNRSKKNEHEQPPIKKFKILYHKPKGLIKQKTKQF